MVRNQREVIRILREFDEISEVEFKHKSRHPEVIFTARGRRHRVFYPCSPSTQRWPHYVRTKVKRCVRG